MSKPLPIPHGIVGGHVAHKPKGKPYAYGANAGFIADAAAKNYDGVDLDLTCSLDGRGFCNHWDEFEKKDAWFNALTGERARMTKTHSSKIIGHTFTNYQGFRYPMMTIGMAADTCKRYHIRPCWEAKNSPPLFTPEFWERFRKRHEKSGITPIVMSLPGTNGQGIRKLAAAHEVGLPTMWLWRGSNLPAGFAKHVDLVKSRPHHGIYRV